jgi:triosephosphate isomerase (TIM)
MRKKIVAANWKMNLLPEEGAKLIIDICGDNLQLKAHQHVIFCAPFTHLHNAHIAINTLNNNQVRLGAQNCNAAASGAYTGEVSVQMLQHVGVSAIIIGHSERRQYFAETHEQLAAKTDTVLAHNMMPIFCCGEPLHIREANTQNDFVAAQLQNSLWHLSSTQIAQVVIAYEPIWAIGTGVTASIAQAQEMHAFIRNLIVTKFGNSIAENITILYGGSCNAANASELFMQADIDGGLIGGAALKAETFLPIIHALN